MLSVIPITLISINLMTLSCIIIDDELHSIQQLEEYIGQISFLKVLKTYTNPLLAVHEINSLEKPVDFLFTDIEMNNISGLELAQLINRKVNCLVLVSSHLKYVVDGYDVNARYFLSKPFYFKKFEKIVNELVSRIFAAKKFLIIKISGKTQPVKVFTDDIILIEGAWDYIKIHTLDKIYIPYLKLKFIEEELKIHSNFKRINRSFIININYVERIEGYNILLRGNLKVNVGRSYQKKFKTDTY